MHWDIPLVGWAVNPALVLILLATVILYWILSRKKYNMPPGPFALPIIGNLIQLYFMKEKLFKTLMEWGKEYGPIMRIYIGMHRCVVVNNIELTLEATIKKPTDFAGRPHFPTADRISMGRKDIVMADYGPTWRLHRKIAYQAMKNYATGKNLELKIHDAFKPISEALSKKTEPVNMHDYINLMIYNFICGFCWGRTYGLDDEEFKTMMQLSDDLNEEFANGMPEDMIPFLRHCPSSKRTKFIAMVDAFYHIVWEKFEQHRDSFDPENIRDFIDDLLLARLEAEKEEKTELMDQLTDTHLFQTITDIFGAGTDTSRFTIIFLIYYMVKYPEVQEKVQQEIDSVVGRDRLPGLADRDSLPYTEATLHEVMRIDPIAPMGVPHSAMVDSSIGGFDVPKDTMVMFNTWAIHMDPKHWDEPAKFDPRRFLNPDGSLAPKPTSFFPFSAGRRVCLGEAVAKPELLLLSACLLQGFTYALPPNAQLPTADTPGALANVPHAFKVLVTPRY